MLLDLLPACLSVSLSVFVCLCLSLSVCVCLSVCLFLSVSVCQSVCLCLSVHTECYDDFCCCCASWSAHRLKRGASRDWLDARVLCVCTYVPACTVCTYVVCGYVVCMHVWYVVCGYVVWGMIMWDMHVVCVVCGTHTCMWNAWCVVCVCGKCVCDTAYMVMRTWCKCVCVRGGLSVLFRAIVVAQSRVIASRVLHESALDRILRAPIRFFDTTPVGRILNRFSRDVDQIDSLLPQQLNQSVSSSFQLCSTLIGICVASEGLFLPVIVPLMLAFFSMQRWYNKSSTVC